MESWLCNFFHRIAMDSRIGPVHISLYAALTTMSIEKGANKAIHIDPAETMAKAKIYSRTTYYRTLRDLHSWGYISYQPAHSKWEKSLMLLPQYP